jgi:excisionase family DNA binding protein
MSSAAKNQDDDFAEAIEANGKTAVVANDVKAPGAPPEFLTVEEAADLLRINRGTLYGIVKNDCPPWAKTIGRNVRISRAALLGWFEKSGAAPRKKRAL